MCVRRAGTRTNAGEMPADEIRQNAGEMRTKCGQVKSSEMQAIAGKGAGERGRLQNALDATNRLRAICAQSARLFNLRASCLRRQSANKTASVTFPATSHQGSVKK
jgi:hypothetical protein